MMNDMDYVNDGWWDVMVSDEDVGGLCDWSVDLWWDGASDVGLVVGHCSCGHC